MLVVVAVVIGAVAELVTGAALAVGLVTLCCSAARTASGGGRELSRSIVSDCIAACVLSRSCCRSRATAR